MRYTPWLLTTVVIVGVTLLCRLGYWQLSRGQEKQHLLALWETQAEKTAITSQALLTSPSQTRLEAWRYSPISLMGSFLNEYTILLDNKTNQGRPGYHVISPLTLNEHTVILVDRGWIPLSQKRTQLPRIPPIMGEVPIEGYLDFAYRNPFVHQPIESNDLKWPLRVQQLDFDSIATLLGKSVVPMLVKLNKPSAISFEIPPARGEWLSPERHYGYACQWFLLALTLGGLYSLYYFRHFRQGKA